MFPYAHTITAPKRVSTTRAASVKPRNLPPFTPTNDAARMNSMSRLHRLEPSSRLARSYKCCGNPTAHLFVCAIMLQAEEFAKHDEIFLRQDADAMAKVLRACNTQDVHEPVQFALVANCICGRHDSQDDSVNSDIHSCVRHSRNDFSRFRDTRRWGRIRGTTWNVWRHCMV